MKAPDLTASKEDCLRDGFFALSSHRLRDLADMIRFGATEIWATVFSLNTFQQAAQSEVNVHGHGAAVSVGLRKELRAALRAYEKTCETLKLEKALSRLEHLRIVLCPDTGLAIVIASEIHGLIQQILNEAASIRFLFVSPEKVQYFEAEELFGPTVNAAFPSAKNEIKCAGNCLALDLNTAAVFHLMRAAELGLRSLAEHFGAKVKNKPLDLAGWDGVIKAIERKIDQRLNPKTPKGSPAVVKPIRKSAKKKAEEREFYRGVMGEFYAFKDVWRNSVMHTRTSYNEVEAVGVSIRVCDFMNRLSTRLSQV